MVLFPAGGKNAAGTFLLFLFVLDAAYEAIVLYWFCFPQHEVAWEERKVLAGSLVQPYKRLLPQGLAAVTACDALVSWRLLCLLSAVGNA